MSNQIALTRRSTRGSLAVTGLLLLSVFPVIGGALRLGEVSADPASAPNPAAGVAIVTHIVAMTTFCVLGAFQFSPALRGRRWHRVAGRVLIPAGVLGGLSAIWLAVFFGGPEDERALALVRLVFSVAMTGFLVLGVVAIARRDFVAHGGWMTRSYALAVTGATQALVLVVWSVAVGEVDAFAETWLLAAGFIVNAVVAELLIMRRSVGIGIRDSSVRAGRRTT